MTVSKSKRSGELLQFNAQGFAQLLHQRRLQLGLSTRELATRAKISQPYVVAKTKKTPTPTVDVIAQLAFALNIDANTLFNQAMQISSRHVLLIVDHSATTPLEIVEQASINQPQTWLCAEKSGDIDLRQTKSRLYKPADITYALNSELQKLRGRIASQTLGLIFSETSEVMTEFDNPQAVLRFENKWADVVNRAVTAAGAQAAFNVCVYKIADLNKLANPTKAINELFEVHDEVWS
ncbi:MAG: XRE family transcriptional regulator, partial [Actinobacteria bacterium]|nr:XRE family transcriptional regulator [Actinomycetota bacterium]